MTKYVLISESDYKSLKPQKNVIYFVHGNNGSFMNINGQIYHSVYDLIIENYKIEKRPV